MKQQEKIKRQWLGDAVIILLLALAILTLSTILSL